MPFFERGLANRLTIISGPAADDYGAALHAWLGGQTRESLSIQCSPAPHEDQCPQRIVEAFASAGIVDRGAVTADSRAHCQTTLIELLNGLAALPAELVVVLFDYHSSDISDRVISFLIDHLPQQIHLYVVAEELPGLACIPRLRVRRQLQLIDTSTG